MKKLLIAAATLAACLGLEASEATAETTEEITYCEGTFDRCASTFRSLNPKFHDFEFHEFDVSFPVDGRNELRWRSGRHSGRIRLDLVISENKRKTTGVRGSNQMLYSCLNARAAFPGEGYDHRVQVAVKYFVDYDRTETIVCLDGDCQSSDLSMQSWFGRPVLPGAACSWSL